MAASSSSSGGRRKEHLLPPLVEGDHGSYLTAINQKLSGIKEDIHETIKDNLGLVMETLDHTTHLSRQVARVSAELKHVRARVSDPQVRITSSYASSIKFLLNRSTNPSIERQNSLFSVLIQSAKHRRQLIDQERHTGVLIKVLEALVEANKAVKLLDELIQQGNVIASLRQRKQLSSLLSSLPGAFSDDKEPIIYTKIKQEFSRLDHQLTQLLQEAYRASINFDVETRVLSVRTSPLFVPSLDLGSSGTQEEYETPNYLSLATTLVCMDHLGLAESQIPLLASTLCSFIDNFLEEPSKTPKLPGLTTSTQGSLSQLTIHAVSSKNKPEPLQLIVASLSSTIAFLEFLTENIISPLFQEALRLDLSGGTGSVRTETSTAGSELSKQLGEHLLAHIMDRLIVCCFEPSIPEQSSLLDEYQKSVASEVDRFMPLLSNFTWLHYGTQTSSSLSSSSEDSLHSYSRERGISKLVSYLKDTRLHFAQNKRRMMLTRARELLLSSVYTSTLVGAMDLGYSEISSDSQAAATPRDGLGLSIFKFPQCRVRDVVIELVEMVQRLWEDAARNSVVSSSLPPSDLPSSQPEHIQGILTDTSRDILDLYRSIVPSLEQSKISKIPSLSMLFHNDCNYIAHHAALIGAKYRFMLQKSHVEPEPSSAWPTKMHELSIHAPSTTRHSTSLSTPSASSSMPTSPSAQNPLKSAIPNIKPSQGPIHSFIDLVPLFRSLAEQFYSSIVDEVRDSLRMILERTGKLMNSHLEDNQQRCMTAMRRIRADLESMDLMWRDTLPKELHKVTMGYLVNEVVQWMVQTAMEISDFGAEETDALNAIFSSLFPLARLFIDVIDTSSSSGESDTKAACAKYVKYWIKFEDLADIFKLPMVDIVARYNDSGFQFSRDEMIQLMLALFADTPKRKGCINSLRNDLCPSPQTATV
jgi:hypothetical protein